MLLPSSRAAVRKGDGMLGPDFEDALTYATRLHAQQRRKGTEIPYVAHLLAVASLVLEHGGGQTEAIAALLHDAPEDQGGEATLAEIRRRFGAAVGDIVAACSDTFEQPKPPWRARKEAYLAHLRAASAASRLVSAADKLHNARSMLSDHRRVGAALWTRFRGGRDGALWYLRSLTTEFLRGGPLALAEDLDACVSELERRATAEPGA